MRKSFFILILLAAVSFARQTSPSQPKTAEQAFKNIQVLKQMDSESLIPSMQFISASLGVGCNYCHVEGAFDKDEKKPKQTARKMLEMTTAINKNNFDGDLEVTCNTCHRGSARPLSTPAVITEEASAEHAPAKPVAAPSPLTPDAANAIIDKYVNAIGGADAIAKVNTRLETGTVNMAGRQVPIDIYIKAPAKRASFMHLPNGDSITAFDGTTSWLGSPGRPPHALSSAEAHDLPFDSELYLGRHLKDAFDSFRTGDPESISGHDVAPLIGLRKDQPPVRLYFDPQSGLLLRMLRYTQTPLGRIPLQIDYADYRDVSGVKAPFRWTISRPGGRFTILLDRVQQNVPVEDARFAMPSSKEAAH
jgi:photosynthetic reaction center cytochrome c subunit